MIKEFLAIGLGALLLCSPIWGAAFFQAWLDRRPTPQQKWEGADHQARLVVD
jgi:hypothetical protein